MFWVKILLTEKEELEDLVEQYGANMSNATTLRVRIMEIVNKSTMTTNLRKKYCKEYRTLLTSLILSSMKNATRPVRRQNNTATD
jgi:hypothetical protein